MYGHHTKRIPLNILVLIISNVLIYPTDVQATKVYNCKIVSVDWLIDSDEAKKPLDEKNYLFNSNSKSDDEDSGDEKKKRTLEEALDLTDDRASKKPKDAQKANSKALNVPVDEGCHLKGELSR